MTMRRSLIPLLLLALLCAAPAAAQDAGLSADRPSGGGGAPTELWDEFPLEQPPPESARGGALRRRGEAPAGAERADDDSASVVQLLLAVGAGLAVLTLAGAGISRRRSRVRVGAAAEPAATPAGPAPSPRPATAAPAGPAPPPAVAGVSAAGHAPVPVSEPVVAPAAAAAASAPLAGPDQATTSIRGGAPATPQAGNGAPIAAPRTASGSPAHAERALGYASVSDSDGKGAEDLKEQVQAIQEACQRRGLTLAKVVRDVESHVSSDLRRPGLTFALDRLAAREASCLVITSLERLTRTAAHLGTMLGWIEECKARLVVLDLDLDTGTHEGKLGARALAPVGGPERKKVEERTRKGLEAARHLRRSGRPAVSDRPSLKRRISEMRAQGMTLQAIADTLNAEGVPTLRGGAEWRPSSVQAAAGYKRPNRKDGPKVRHGESREKSG
jgi:DNA invertase Pin-like site-specific DNA recombinase